MGNRKKRLTKIRRKIQLPHCNTMYSHPGTEPVPIHRVRIRRHTRLRSAKTTGTGPFPRCGTAIPWLRFGGPRSPMESRLGSPAVVTNIVDGTRCDASETYSDRYRMDVRGARRFYNLHLVRVWL